MILWKRSVVTSAGTSLALNLTFISFSASSCFLRRSSFNFRSRMVTFLPRLASYGVQRYTPGLRQWQQKLGRGAQRHVLTQMFGDTEQDLIRPGADHPGHV